MFPLERNSMTNISRVVEQGQKSFVKVRNYAEVTAYLDSLKKIDYSEEAVSRMQKINAALSQIALKKDLIIVAGSNGKSSTVQFAAKLLKEEGLKVAALYSNHILNYNERILIDATLIANKSFVDAVNQVIQVVDDLSIQATAYEIVYAAGLLQAVAEEVDVVLVEAGLGGKYDAVAAFTPCITALTRVADAHSAILGTDLDQMAFDMMEVAKAGSWLVSAEQSKIRLQKMKTKAEEKGVFWAMPIRKLAPLPYIFEQLYGRAASLAERIAQMYVEEIKQRFSPFLRGNLLATERGRRGRPTTEAKQNSILNPIKTLKHFWLEHFELLHGRFELLDKEKPTVLLDNAENIDAFENFFLGMRLLHYQKQLKGVSLIIGIKAEVDALEMVKLMRYLFKKVAGFIFFVPLPEGVACHDPFMLETLAKDLNVKAKGCTSFAEAFEGAKKMVDERHGVVAVTGSIDLLAEYWKQRNIKKL
jgi:folylpolyglutamate synthase/dihydrofolate synthase